MQHVHPPHGAPHSWKDFLLQIATIATGLLLALGLEQTVEWFHHRHQRAELEEQMRATLEGNKGIYDQDRRVLAGTRAYWEGLRQAVDAKMHGGSRPIPEFPGVTYVGSVTLGPYDAAISTGVNRLLPLNRILMYGRIADQTQSTENALREFTKAMSDLRAFGKRLGVADDSGGHLLVPRPVPLEGMTPAELAEYRALLGAMIDAGDRFVIRTRRTEAMIDAFLGGAKDERELVEALRQKTMTAPAG